MRHKEPPRFVKVKRPINRQTIIVGVILALILGIYGYLLMSPYPFENVPPEFSKKVAIAEQEIKKINVGPVLKEETVLRTTGRYSDKRVCTRGSYSTKENPEIRNGMWCSKGYVKYIGLTKLDEAAIENLHASMQSLGWQLTSSMNEFTAQKKFILTQVDRGGGFSYTNAEGIVASLSFARRDAQWQDCKSYTTCRMANDRVTDPYEAIVSVTVIHTSRPF